MSEVASSLQRSRGFETLSPPFLSDHPERLLVPPDRDKLVHHQKRNRRESNPRRQRISAEEVADHARPTGASSDQSAADKGRSHCGREVRPKDVPEPEELTQTPDDDKKFNSDSYLSPTFFRHVENCSSRQHLRDKSLFHSKPQLCGW